MCKRFTFTLAGGCPRTPERHFRTPQGGRPAWPVPASPRPNAGAARIGVRAGPDRRTGLPDPLRLCARRFSRSPGRAEPVPPTGTFAWDPSRPPAARGGEGTRPRREERTESVPDAGGTGAEAVATQTTSLAGHSADSAAKADGRRPAVIGRRRENIRRLADRRDLRTPNRERRRSGGELPWGSEGAQPPASLRRGLTECGHTE